MKKLNCWDYKKCGRALGGNNRAREVCPTAVQIALNGTHGGLCGGRSCWVVEGTLCNGRKQGSYGEKYAQCGQCDFYRMVMREEGIEFVLSSVLLKKMRSKPELPRAAELPV